LRYFLLNAFNSPIDFVPRKYRFGALFHIVFNIVHLSISSSLLTVLT